MSRCHPITSFMSSRAWKRFVRLHHWHAPHGCTLAKSAGIVGAVAGAALGMHVAMLPVGPTPAGAATGVAPVVVSDGASAVGATVLAWLPVWFGGNGGAPPRWDHHDWRAAQSPPIDTPEPSTLAVFGAGVVMLIGMKELRKR